MIWYRPKFFPPKFSFLFLFSPLNFLPLLQTLWLELYTGLTTHMWHTDSRGMPKCKDSTSLINTWECDNATSIKKCDSRCWTPYTDFKWPTNFIHYPRIQLIQGREDDRTVRTKWKKGCENTTRFTHRWPTLWLQKGLLGELYTLHLWCIKIGKGTNRWIDRWIDSGSGRRLPAGIEIEKMIVFFFHSPR